MYLFVLRAIQTGAMRQNYHSGLKEIRAGNKDLRVTSFHGDESHEENKSSRKSKVG